MYHEYCLIANQFKNKNQQFSIHTCAFVVYCVYSELTWKYLTNSWPLFRLPCPLNLHILTQSTKQDLKHQSVGTLMPCQGVTRLPKFSPPPGRSQPGVSLLAGKLSACLVFNVEPGSFRNSGSFELTDPRMVAFYRELPGSFSQMFWK